MPCLGGGEREGRGEGGERERGINEEEGRGGGEYVEREAAIERYMQAVD